jgi:general secretion pathway protein I
MNSSILRVALRSRGMTLLEVMVALAIFATASLSVMRAVSQHIETVSYLEEKQFAAMVVDNQMARLMLDPAQVTASQGQVRLAGRDWWWKVTPIATTNAVLRAFDVTVASSESSSPIVTVRSYVPN